jgi:2-amino-4-hydroxy-6-hydroxymethyldihydropteridine diphosphokinase
MNNVAYIGMGSNMEDRFNYLKQGILLLHKEKNITLTNLSSIYETAPVGYTEQSAFLNMVVEVETTYNPQELLSCLQKIEAACHRERIIRWGPRTLDLDILLYNNEDIKEENLSVPHPRILERAFVLAPLVEIAPSACILGDNHFLSSLTSKLSVEQDIEIWKLRDEKDIFSLLETN